MLRKHIELKGPLQPQPTTESMPAFARVVTFPLPVSEFFLGLHALFAPVLDDVSLPRF